MQEGDTAKAGQCKGQMWPDPWGPQEAPETPFQGTQGANSQLGHLQKGPLRTREEGHSTCQEGGLSLRAHPGTKKQRVTKRAGAQTWPQSPRLGRASGGPRCLFSMNHSLGGCWGLRTSQAAWEPLCHVHTGPSRHVTEARLRWSEREPSAPWVPTLTAQPGGLLR